LTGLFNNSFTQSPDSIYYKNAHKQVYTYTRTCIHAYVSIYICTYNSYIVNSVFSRL